MRKTGTVKKMIALLLVIVMVAGFTGCAFFDRIQRQIDPKSSHIAAPELARLLIEAVDDSSRIGHAYESIPESQRENITFSYFTEYVDILAKMSKQYGKITRFEFFDEEENAVQLANLSQMSAFEDYESTYGKLRSVRLLYDDPEVSSVIYISVDNEGDAYLSDEWVSNCLRVYNYMEHYLGMIDDANTEGIAGLLKSAGAESGYPDAVYTAKAGYIAEYYRIRVKEDVDKLPLRSVSAFCIDYEIPEILAQNGKSFFSRDIYALMGSDGDIRIVDDMPLEVDSSIIEVNLSPVQLLRCGLTYDYSALTRLCGKPLSTYVPRENISVKENEEGKEIPTKRLVLQYNGLSLTFEAEYIGEKNWTGELVSIRIIKNSKTNYACCDIKVGDSEIDIVKRFPMIEYGNYTLFYSAAAKNYELEYFIKDGLVDSILITSVKTST